MSVLGSVDRVISGKVAERHWETMLLSKLAACAALLFIGSAATACADDWVASKLRGQVVQLVNNEWVPLRRGDVVDDTRYVATMASGHVEFTRGGETIGLDPNTRIRIFDKASSKPFTTVKQDFGTVSVEANVENVQHFSVQTPYVAAVVKGTRFTVSSGKTGATVSVRRGHVEVDDLHNQTHTTIAVGQSATVDKIATASALVVAGEGTLPQILDKKGNPVPAATTAAAAKQSVAALAAAAKAAEAQAKLLKTPEAKAAADAAKKAADAAKKEADQAAKDDKKSADAAKKAADQAAKDEKDAAKDADKATKDATKYDGGSSGSPGPNGGPGSGGGTSGGGGDSGGGKDKPDKPAKPDKDK